MLSSEMAFLVVQKTSISHFILQYEKERRKKVIFFLQNNNFNWQIFGYSSWTDCGKSTIDVENDDCRNSSIGKRELRRPTRFSWNGCPNG